MAAPTESTEPLWVTVRPKHTDHEFAPTPDDPHTQSPSLTPDVVEKSIAACTAPPPDDLIAQTCATTSVTIARVAAQRHVLELEVIGFVLP